eukprot:5278818-Pyramimonas_sp.AAC.1
MLFNLYTPTPRYPPSLSPSIPRLTCLAQLAQTLKRRRKGGGEGQREREGWSTTEISKREVRSRRASGRTRRASRAGRP